MTMGGHGGRSWGANGHGYRHTCMRQVHMGIWLHGLRGLGWSRFNRPKRH